MVDGKMLVTSTVQRLIASFLQIHHKIIGIRRNEGTKNRKKSITFCDDDVTFLVEITGIIASSTMMFQSCL